MRVLVVTNMYPTDERPAWGTFVESQVRSLRQLGLSIDVEVIEGIRDKVDYLRAMFRVRARCAAHDYDLVHAHYGLSAIVARAQFRCPLVISFCGDDLYGHSDAAGRVTPTSRSWVFLGRLVSRRAAGVIVKSDAMAALLPRPPDAVIPNGVDMEMFKPGERSAARRSLGLDPDGRYILFPYAPDNLRKNHAAIVAAADALNREGSDRWRILVVQGEPPARLPTFMNAADVFVLASFWEGSPNVVKEAMACNMRVVSVPVGDVAELIDGVRGCRLCRRDPADIAAAVRAVTDETDPPQTRAAVSHLELGAVARRVIEVYRHALSPGRPAT